MLELKVQCDCGQKYKFDVEPQNGQMPFTVTCPLCGTDGTAKANQLLSELAPTTPSQAAAPFPAKLRIGTQHARVAEQEPQLPPPVPAASVAQPRAIPRMPGARPQAAAQAGDKPPASFGLGFLGALAGAIVGATVYFLLFKYTGLKFKPLAIAVGFLSGMSAEWLGRKEGSKELGMIAAALTIAAIVGAQFFVAKSWWQEDLGSAYTEAVSEAKAIMKAVPNGTDQEIRIYLAKEESFPGEKVEPSEISDEEVTEFKNEFLPEMRDLASGKTTQKDFEKALQGDEADTSSAATSSDEDLGDFKAEFLLLLLSKVNLVSLAAAAGLAFKLCSNA